MKKGRHIVAVAGAVAALTCTCGAEDLYPLPESVLSGFSRSAQGSVILVRQKDQPGIIAGVSRILGEADVNISFMTARLRTCQALIRRWQRIICPEAYA